MWRSCRNARPRRCSRRCCAHHRTAGCRSRTMALEGHTAASEGDETETNGGTDHAPAFGARQIGATRKARSFLTAVRILLLRLLVDLGPVQRDAIPRGGANPKKLV